MGNPAKYVTRVMWGSTFNYSSNTVMPPSPRGVALHWEGTRLGTFAHFTCVGRVRSIEKFHVEKRGWAGIAYNALVCPHGYIYEGRGLRYRSAANGDVPQNNAYFAVCYLGGPGDPLTEAAQDAYVRAVQWLVADGNAGDDVVGHRDLTATSCPGDEIYTWLNATDFENGATPPVPTVAVWGRPDTWKIGSVGPDVTLLGERLVVWAKALSLPPPYAEGPGPLFTETDRAAVAAFQTAQGWTGSDADGYPGLETFRRLASIPPEPTPEETLVETLSGNLAAYDKVHGMRTREQRAKTVIPAYLDNHQPDWFHFQECSADMLDEMDTYMKKRSYRRVPEGGKGRESWYDTKAGIVVVEAKLLNVEHMLLKDTKEHLVIAYTKNGVGAVDVNFHNENEGTIQSVQLRDVMTHGREMADKHKYPRANILVTGDANFKGAAAFAKLQQWSEVIYIAVKKIDLGYVSTNGWVNRVVGGRRIDVDVVQRDAEILEAEQHFAAVNGKPISDHWLHRVVRRLK